MVRRPAPLPTPVELGFPPKFHDYYQDQLEAIDKIVTNPRRFTALAMPTGSGKSLTGVTAAMLHPNVRRAVYLTSTKGLQDQLAADFEPVGLVDLRGARNYPCLMVEPLSTSRAFRVGCDEGPCHADIWCSKAPEKAHPDVQPLCLYYGALWQARHATLISTNYAMYFSTEGYAQGLGPIEMVILDEAHDAQQELESFLAIELSTDDVRTVGRKFHSRSLSEWRDWANSVIKPLEKKLKTNPSMSTPREVQERLHLKTLVSKLSRLAEIEPEQWVLDDNGMRARFCPLRIARYAEQHLFRGVRHVVLMSATLTHKTLADLGIGREQYSFWEAPSRFPVERRPIVSLSTTPSVRVDKSMTEDDKVFWIRRIDRLIDSRRRLGWKGIIHTVSYQRMKELMARSDHRDIMIVHDSYSTREAIREFKDSNGPRLLVSPSIVTGYDFPDDECRFQIIGKVPMPDMRSPVMAARAKVDKEYAGYLAMQKLVQACGRGMRGPCDWCETFIVDDHFGDWFLRRNRRYAPRWFYDAVERMEYFPDPLVVD